MNTIASIDPGKSGSIAILRNGELTVHKMGPPREVCDIFEKAQADSLSDTFGPASSGGSMRVYIEKVSGFIGEKQPGSSAFVFGCGFGVLIGALTALKIPFELVTPQQWQKSLSLGSRGLQKPNIVPGMTDQQRTDEKRRVSTLNAKLKAAWKSKLRDVAQQLWPSVKVTLQLADALLILEWARRRERAEKPQPAQKELAV